MEKNLTDKKKDLREKTHLTRPPRMEGKVKNAKMNPIKKTKKSELHSITREPVYRAKNGYEQFFGDGFGEKIEDNEY